MKVVTEGRRTGYPMRLGLLSLTLGVLLAACTQSTPTPEPTPSPIPVAPAPTPETAPARVTVMVTPNVELGNIVTDADGNTLYVFTKDERGLSNCYDPCAQRWPPLLTVGDPAAEESVTRGLLGTTTRQNGSTQVTYNGWPLYYWFQDEKPGDTNGQDVDGVWFVLSPYGGPIQTNPPINTQQHPELGTILTDASGRTLYLYTKDERDTPSCFNGCARAWPPLITVGDSIAGEGVTGDLLGTVERRDGSTQATYNGWPLYYFFEDEKPGDTNGQDVGGVLFVVSPEGTAVTGPMLIPESKPQSEPSGVYKQSPWWPYLSAHIENENPPDIIGGPITVHVTQESGGANWTFPGPRKLDPTVFGTADKPKGTELPALILGVPEELRETLPDGTQQTKVPTPFSDKLVASTRGSVRMTVVDATATDGATTKDRIDFEATFEAPNGQGQYRVVVQKAAPHGWFIPTAGGVITNFIQHGVTGWGTRLMPTEYVYVAFWGLGDIFKDGELVAQERLVHVMLTEFVREAPYDLAFDEGVNPNARHLHMIVPPFTVYGDPSPVTTGFILPNGMEQPFLHVMFPDVQVEAGRIPQQQAEASRKIEVRAKSFEFGPNAIEVIAGQPVEFVAHSEDIFHTFSVKLNQEAAEDLFSLDLFPGETVTYLFTPTESGTLYVYCKPHQALGMVGAIHVVEPGASDTSAAPPADSDSNDGY